MDVSTTVLLALALSADSFAASVSSGLVIKRIQFLQAFRIACFLSIFQAGMPLIGWYAGLGLKNAIKDYDHWIAFFLLTGLGGKIIFESLNGKNKEKCFNPLKWTMLIGISIATSIDALIIGVSFALLEIFIFIPILIIGITTFLASMLGSLLGKKLENRFNQHIEILGGVVLIGIGTRILIEHLLQ